MFLLDQLFLIDVLSFVTNKEMNTFKNIKTKIEKNGIVNF